MTNDENPLPLERREEPVKPMQHVGEAMLSLVDKLAQLRAKQSAVGTIPPTPSPPPGEWCEGCKQYHVCTRCHDHGFLSHPREDDPIHTEIIPCNSAVCLAKRHQQHTERLNATDIGVYRDCRFETIWPRPWQRPAYDLALAYAQRRPPHGLLYFLGPNGRGKSALAAAIAWVAVDAGYRTLFYRTTTLLNTLRDTFSADPEVKVSYHSLLQMVKEVPVLVLDDLGQERQTEWVQELYFDVLDYRYRHAETLATIVTTNMQLASLPAALLSRITDASLSQVCLIVGGQDQRPKPTYQDHVVHEAQWPLSPESRAEHKGKDGVTICHMCNCLPCHPKCPLGGEDADG